MTKQNGRAIVVWISAGILVLTGVVTIIVGLLTPVSFGWFAYQPLANASFAPVGDSLVLSRTTATGLGVLAVGLIVAAFTMGWRAGSRRRL